MSENNVRPYKPGHQSNGINYEAAIQALIQESKSSGIEKELDNVIGKVADKGVDILQNKLDDVTSPDL